VRRSIRYTGEYTARTAEAILRGIVRTAARLRASFLPPLLALAAFELRAQRREFLAWLAALVFLLLPLGYGASGVVELVGERGGVPRAAPWAVAQAMAGLTAFGQVITAMIAATAVLRDVAGRTQGLLLATPVPWPAYLLGRFLGTLAVLLLVYAVIPLGMAAGLALGDAAAVGPWGASTLLAPFAVLVIPTVVLVAALFFAAGARSGGFAVILLVGIGLVGVWQTGVSLAARGVAAGVWLDPFGNAALTQLTAGWSEAERTSRPLPWAGGLLWHRGVWLGVALGVLAWTVRGWRPVLGGERLGEERPVPARARAVAAPVAPALAPAVTRVHPSAWHQGAAEWRFGWRWVVRERGFAALVLLAVLNALANGWSVAGDPAALLRALEFHARLFAILVATIYAGELVWRDRELRLDGVMRALPGASGTRLAGRTAGVLCGLMALPAALWLLAVALPPLRGGVPAPACAVRWLFGVSAPLFAALLAGALAVQLVVRHKTAAHLLVIGAWVTAIALGARGLAAPWGGYGAC